eukprot:Colp12_sorted_trinity150504_noHs@30342
MASSGGDDNLPRNNWGHGIVRNAAYTATAGVAAGSIVAAWRGLPMVTYSLSVGLNMGIIGTGFFGVRSFFHDLNGYQASFLAGGIVAPFVSSIGGGRAPNVLAGSALLGGAVGLCGQWVHEQIEYARRRHVVAQHTPAQPPEPFVPKWWHRYVPFRDQTTIEEREELERRLREVQRELDELRNMQRKA